jgi:hypothetical protein
VFHRLFMITLIIWCLHIMYVYTNKNVDI